MTPSKELALFSDAVESIYDAALEPSRWPLAAEKISHLHGSPKTVLFAVRTGGNDTGFAFPYGISASGMELWNTRYAREDVWVKGSIEKGLFREGVVAIGEEMVSDEAFLGSDFYRDFLRPLDVGRLMSGVVFDGTRPMLPVSACSVMRPRNGGPYDAHDRELHRLITNHLSKAMGTMFRLRDAELRVASSLAALQRVPSPVLLVGADKKIRFVNSAAERVLQSNDGVCLKLSRARAGQSLGALTVNDGATQARLERLLDASVALQHDAIPEHFSQALRVSRPSGAADYLIQIAPLGRDNEYSERSRDMRAIVFISDPAAGQHEIDDATLSQAYQMTTAEIALAREIMLGDSLKKTALRMGLSENTVKSQLQSIFAKTQTQRQSQLIKLLLALPRAAQLG